LRFLPLEELPPPRAFPREDSRTTGSPVPCKSLNRARALFTPDAAGAVSRSPPGLSQDHVPFPGSDITLSISTLPQGFGFTRLHDPHLTQSQPRLFCDAHHPGSLPAQLTVVCCLLLQSDSGGPFLHLLHSTDNQQPAPTRPADYRSGHTYAAAFERNSTFILSSRFSRSSSRRRARSEIWSVGSSSACLSRYLFTQPPRVASLTFISRATWTIGREDSTTILAASSLNSGEYSGLFATVSRPFLDKHPNGCLSGNGRAAQRPCRSRSACWS
jgi:hypothetical protein